MARGSSGGNGPINAKIILELTSQGSIDQAIDQLTRAKEAQDALAQSAAAAASADDKLESATYDVGRSYEVLEADLKRASTAMEKEVVAAQWMARQAAELSDAMQGLADHERTAETATINLTAAQQKAGTGATAAGNQGGLSAYKWLLLGNAIQDVQYGFAAIVNNIPGIVMAFGGSAGLAGGIGIAAVAAQQLLAHIGDIRTMLGQEAPQHLIYDIKALNDELKKLEDKPYKTKIDFSEIDLAKKKLDTLTEAQAAFERLKSGKSKAAQEAGKLASEAIIEHGGGDDFESSADRVARAAAAVTTPAESAATKKLREQIDRDTKALDHMSPESAAARGVDIDAMEKKLKASIADDAKNHVDVVRGMVGRAGAGYSGDIDWLRGLVERHPQAFKAQGAGPGLLPGLMKSGRDQVEDRKVTENALKIAKDDRQAADKIAKADQKEAEAEDKAQEHLDKSQREFDSKLADWQAKGREQSIDDAVKRTRPGVEDQLVAGLYEHGRAGEDLAGVVKDERPKLMDQLGKRGVGGEIVGEVADKILDQAREKALNAVASGKPPTLVKREESEREKQARTLGAGFVDQAEAIIDQNRLGQKTTAPRDWRAEGVRPEADVRKELESRIGHDLRQAGQDPTLSIEIVKGAIEKADLAYAKALARTGDQVQALADLVNGSLVRIQAQAANQDRVDRTIREGNQRFRKRPIANRPHR